MEMRDGYRIEQAAKSQFPMDAPGPCEPNQGVAQGQAYPNAHMGYPAFKQQQVMAQFDHRSPTANQVAKMNLVREAAKMLALTILANVPDVPGGQADAIIQIRVATMFANAAIVGAE